MTEKRFMLLVFLAVLIGCTGTVKDENLQGAGGKETERAWESVASAVSGQQVNGVQLRDLTKELRKDEKARSAVESISGALEGRPGSVKYCPVDGQRYNANFTICPVHGVELKPVDE